MNSKLQIKKARLALYLKAEKAILSGQSYEIEGLKLTRASLEYVQKAIRELESDIARLSGSGRARRRCIVPMDR